MKKKILVIDDSMSVRQQLAGVLSAAGYEVREAADGIQGAERIRQEPDLALVLCDVNMPRQNGLEMLESLKEHIVARGLPVMMLTTEGDPQAILRAKQAGARAWLVKPFKEHLLLSAIQKLTDARV